MFGLETEDWGRLAQSGSLATDRHGHKRRGALGRFGPCLVYHAELTGFLGDYLRDYGEDCVHDPQRMLELVESMRLAHHTEFGLELASGDSLERLLRRHRADAGEDRWTVGVPGGAYASVMDNPEHCGRCWVCSCGVADCDAAACWIDGGTPMLWCRATGGALLSLTLYPRLMPGGQIYPEELGP